MSIEALILGKLHQRAESRTSKNGKPFVTATVRAAAGEDNVLFVRVVAFSETACTALLALGDGDSLALAGTLKPTAWIDKAGDARAGADLVAAQVLTTYGLAKRRTAVRGDSDDGADAGRPSAGARRPPSQQHRGDDLDGGDDDAWLRGGGA